MTLKDQIFSIIRKRCISDIAAEHAAEDVEMLIEIKQSDEEKLKEAAWIFIAENDENANIIADGKIEEASKFMAKFIVHLYESGFKKTEE